MVMTDVGGRGRSLDFSSLWKAGTNEVSSLREFHGSSLRSPASASSTVRLFDPQPPRVPRFVFPIPSLRGFREIPMPGHVLHWRHERVGAWMRPLHLARCSTDGPMIDYEKRIALGDLVDCDSFQSDAVDEQVGFCEASLEPFQLFQSHNESLKPGCSKFLEWGCLPKNYISPNVKGVCSSAPRVAGLPVKMFAWVLETPVLGSVVLKKDQRLPRQQGGDQTDNIVHILFCLKHLSVTREVDHRTSKLMQFIFAGNLLGLPAITVPVGHDKQGLPIGLQLIGRPWGEAILLRVASAVEELCLKKRNRPSTFYDILKT
ncbi:Glutamyl-tRNA(Gln) amidotransferase subunit A [Hordeum vulgare]|nr:Glutamyl-tRNA(Gln) amidotransferase subunit A [Hordeum vulgare]